MEGWLDESACIVYVFIQPIWLNTLGNVLAIEDRAVGGVCAEGQENRRESRLHGTFIFREEVEDAQLCHPMNCSLNNGKKSNQHICS